MRFLPASADELEALPPIPEIDAFDTSAYHNVPVDLAAPENSEHLVNIAEHGIAGEAYYHRSDGQNLPYGGRLKGSLPMVLVRSGIAQKLQQVNRSLAPLKLELFVWDGYRPVETQQGIWDYFKAEFRAARPDARTEEIEALVLRYVSDPRAFSMDDPTSWPTHMTGASVDLTLRSTEGGALLEMGAHFDQMESVAQTCFYETALKKSEVSPDDPRLLNRRLLYHAMAQQGFTNYHQEFWHFDFGNQMHALVKSKLTKAEVASAVYGAVRSD